MDCSMVSVLRFITVSEIPVIPASVSTVTRTQLRNPRCNILVRRSVIFMDSDPKRNSGRYVRQMHRNVGINLFMI